MCLLFMALTTTGQAVLTGGVSVMLWILGWLTALQWPVVVAWMETFGGAS